MPVVCPICSTGIPGMYSRAQWPPGVWMYRIVADVWPIPEAPAGASGAGRLIRDIAMPDYPVPLSAVDASQHAITGAACPFPVLRVHVPHGHGRVAVEFCPIRAFVAGCHIFILDVGASCHFIPFRSRIFLRGGLRLRASLTHLPISYRYFTECQLLFVKFFDNFFSWPAYPHAT